jgi:hypothetical protein
MYNGKNAFPVALVQFVIEIVDTASGGGGGGGVWTERV